jgi:peptide/nickel transport system permease protein
MWAYAIRRLLQMALLLFLSSVVVFLLLRLIPGDPAMVIGGPNARPEQLERLRNELGLTQPLPVQYAIWAGRVVRGDLGTSFVSGFPVSQLIVMRVPATAQLAVGALLIALLVAFPAGMVAATRPDSALAHALSGYTTLALVVPTFWLGLLLLLFFGLQLRWLPMSGYVGLAEDPAQALQHLLLPSITLAAGLSAILARLLKAALLEVLRNDYVRTARAKGLHTELILRRHVLKNALIPVVTVLGIQVGHLLGGAVITESIFDWPGLGKLILQGINDRDYTVVQGVMLFLVSTFVLVNLVVDLSYGLLDPRIRYSGR